MTSPFQPMRSPQFGGPGGGNAMPPYLQGRKPNPGLPMLTPGPGVAQPGTPGAKPLTQPIMGGARRPMGMGMGGMFGMARTQPGLQPQGVAKPWFGQAAKKPPTKLPIPGAQSGTGPQGQGQGNTPQTLYDFFKQDLENQRQSAMADTTSNAASRGVYYGTPLTTSYGDINTQYLRGLGQLQAGVLQNEQGNELSRLGIASGLLGSMPNAQIGPNSQAYQLMGQIFGNNPTAPAQPGQPGQIPLQKTGDKLTPQPRVW